MTVLYVASDAVKAGKTAFCASFAKLLSSQGKKTALLKLWPDGRAEHDSDVSNYNQLFGKAVVTVESADSVGAAQSRLEALYKNADVVIVEGLSGLDNEQSGEFVSATNAKVVVLSKYRYGMQAGELEHAKVLFGDRLLGIVINGITKYAGTQVREGLVPSVDSLGIRVLGTIPEDRRLISFSVEQLREHLGGRYFGYVEDNMRTNLVEEFVIGCNVVDWGLQYYSRNEDRTPRKSEGGSVFNTSSALGYFGIFDKKAVIVRWNRPDIQMAALQTPTSCLVSTGGKEPLEYVVYEAEQEETPIIVVDTDTLSTAKALESIGDRRAFDHTLKLDRFTELMKAGVDVDGVESAIAGKN